VIVVRYADDAVLGFQHRADAEPFLRDWKERLSRFGAISPIPNFLHMRPNCVIGSSPRIRSPGVAGRLYKFFQSTYSASGTPYRSIHARKASAAAQEP
jgi:hypothetical protein